LPQGRSQRQPRPVSAAGAGAQIGVRVSYCGRCDAAPRTPERPPSPRDAIGGLQAARRRTLQALRR